MRTPHQHVHAMRAHHPHEQCTEQPHRPSGVPEGVRHRQDTGAYVALEQMDHGVEIGGRVFEFAFQQGVGVILVGGDVVQVDTAAVDWAGVAAGSVGVALMVAVEKGDFFVAHFSLLAL